LYQDRHPVKLPKPKRGRKAAKLNPEVASVALPAGEPTLDTDPTEEPINELNMETLNSMVEQARVRERELETTLQLVKDKKITRAELQLLMAQGQQFNLLHI
jgi:hypothetical protein